MKPLIREVEKLGDALPMLTREFEVLEMIPVAKRTLTPAEIEARAARAERRKKKAGAGEEPDPADEEDDDTEENSAAGKRDEDRFDISISSGVPGMRWLGNEILDHLPDALEHTR